MGVSIYTQKALWNIMKKYVITGEIRIPFPDRGQYWAMVDMGWLTVIAGRDCASPSATNGEETLFKLTPTGAAIAEAYAREHIATSPEPQSDRAGASTDPA